VLKTVFSTSQYIIASVPVALPAVDGSHDFALLFLILCQIVLQE